MRPAVCTGFKNCMRYHLGSLAFGAFLIAVVQWLKAFCYYLEQQAKVQKNVVMVYLLKCMQYLLDCFERCLKFLNKNAYIQIAIKGSSFCGAAWDAFCLILRNAARIAALAMMGGMINLFGVLFIMVFTAFLGYNIV